MRFLAIRIATLTALVFGLLASSASAHNSTSLCRSGYYKNVNGRCVHRPAKAPSAPAGATAKCYDGTYSYSLSRSGTCSHHGGVARWL